MMRISAGNISFTLFLALLIFAPLAFGTVENWSFLVLETCTAAAFILAAACPWSKKIRAAPGMLPLLLLQGLILLQLVPLPPGLVETVSPAAFAVYASLPATGSDTGFIPLTLNPRATLLSFLTLSAFILFYLLTVQHLARAARLQKAAAVVAVLGPLIAIEAILQKLVGSGTIYWIRDAPANASPVGPWVYSNHFAGYMEMVFPLVVALFLYNRPQVRYDTTFRDRVLTLFTMPGANRYLLLATGAVLMAVSILLSLSRAGIITLCLAFFFFVIFTAGITRDRRSQWAVLITASVMLIFTWLGWQPLIDEFGKLWGAQGLNTSGRLPVYLDTLEMAGDFPLIGAGAGTFLHVYPAFRSVSGNAIFDHAHSDYLEILAETGAAGFLLAAWFVAAVFLHVLRRLRQRRERYSILLAAAALTGMLALLFHSLVDFQVSNGANGLYFFFLCGLAVSAANTRLHYRTRPTLLPASESLVARAVPLLAAVLLLVLSASTRTGIMRAHSIYEPVRQVYLNRNIPPAQLAPMRELTAAARRHDPLEAYYPYRMGSISLLLGEKGRAREELLAACRLNPMAGAYLQQLALSLPAEETDRARELMTAAIRREPRSVERYLLYSDWLLLHAGREETFAVLGEAAAHIPSEALRIARHIRDRNFSDAEVARILPPLPHAWYAMGRIHETAGRIDAAENSYLQAIEHLDGTGVRPEYFIRLHALYRRQGESGKALEIVRMGMKYLPENAWFRIQLGNSYMERGIPYRAVEEFRAALRLDPDNTGLARKVRELEQGSGGPGY
jgi:tetratricopeptide (TPR) repeat protein